MDRFIAPTILLCSFYTYNPVRHEASEMQCFPEDLCRISCSRFADSFTHQDICEKGWQCMLIELPRELVEKLGRERSSYNGAFLLCLSDRVHNFVGKVATGVSIAKTIQQAIMFQGSNPAR